MSSTAFSGVQLRSRAPTRRTVISRAIVAKGKKIDVKKQGVNSVKDESVRKNLMGVSDSMKKKDWVDSQGRKGKGLGVYRYADKYGVNVDGYSPIFTPDIWADSGDEYSLGTKGLLAWGGLIVVLLAVGVNLVVSTSQLGL